ncbi:MAG: enolase C-terminal domain-like protein [Phycisphaeraceae bacterium]
MADIRITDVKVFITQPGMTRHTVVRVETNQPGLVGLGDATFTYRHHTIVTAVETSLRPWLIGKDPRTIEDLWQGMMFNAYWRQGPVLNAAISGVDMALWDIKGKLAGMPCYQLWGGACRGGVLTYSHVGGATPEEVVDNARAKMQQRFTHLRCQQVGYRGPEPDAGRRPRGAQTGQYFDARAKLRSVPAMFELLRRELGDEVELLHDIHSRLAPADAIQLAKSLEPYRLFFLEDILAPEHADWLEALKSQCATPIALGELFSHPQQLTPLIARRLIDFVRVHPAMIGGITPALKLTHLAEAFGVRTAWHCPPDVSPPGVAANVHLSLMASNFGIQEWGDRPEAEYEIFPGTPRAEGPYVYANDQPGLGVEFDEAKAAGHPGKEDQVAATAWTLARLPDGSIWAP